MIKNNDLLQLMQHTKVFIVSSKAKEVAPMPASYKAASFLLLND
jgi:hypothetical protein